MLQMTLFVAGADPAAVAPPSPGLDQLAGVAILSLLGALVLVVLIGALPSVWVLLARASTSVQRREARACLRQMIQIVVLIVVAIVMLARDPWSEVPPPARRR